MNRLLPPPDCRERGQTMILAAIMLPVVVGVAALGIGAAMVRSADSEVQRTANLSALAAAANAPVLGRPSTSGLPTIPTTLDDSTELPLPPEVNAPGNVGSYATGGIYNALYTTSTQADRNIAAKLHLGALTQPVATSLGGNWAQGCTVGEAQFTAGRAKLGRNYAAEHDNAGNPVVPHCATNGVFNDGTAQGAQHIYIRPEMESTGAYRLERCLQQPADCASQLGVSNEQSALSTMGAAYTTALNTALGYTNPQFICNVDPTATNCPLNSTLLSRIMSGSAATAVQKGVQDSIAKVAGKAYSSYQTDENALRQLGELLLGKTVANATCPTKLGQASGQTLCNPGVNLASMLPAILTPRVRGVVHHAVDFPFVPSITGAKVGDFDFAEQALARRTFKNAVVVPTMPANFGVGVGADTTCLTGYASVGIGGMLMSTLQTLITLNNPPAAQCKNADVDGAASGSFTLDLNPTLAESQSALITAAKSFNGYTNTAINSVVAPAVGRNASECNQSPPAAWCIDAGGQAIRDLQDIYNPPGGGTAPTAGDVMQRAYQNNEDVAVVSLGKYVTIPLPGAVGGFNAMTYWIPAFDVVPATVTSYDPNDPSKTKLRVSSAPHGLYKGVLLDATADLYPLCTETPSSNGYCFDQPPS